MKRILWEYTAAPRLIRFTQGEVTRHHVRCHRQRMLRVGGGLPAGNELDILAVGNCYLLKEDQDLEPKKDQEYVFVLDW